MRGTVRAIAALAGAAASLATVGAISKVTRAGRYLYTDDGNRFYIKGIAYQEQGTVVASSDNSFGEPSTFIDPLVSASACSRDLPFLQQLGVNTIRAYSVNSSLNHDACMSTFSNAGIYVIIDLALPLNGSIDRDSPAWSTNLLDQYIATIDTFKKYDNVLAYNVGNEVVIDNGTAVAPFVKAAARDVKSYLTSISSSALVGYAAIDGTADWRDPTANFLSCDVTNSNSDGNAIDLYGLNNYEWCGNSTFEASYAGTNGDYAGYNVVAYFSEFGCVEAGVTRLWTETGALFGPQMSPIWSGGLAFSYFPAQSAAGQFGMVTISSDGSNVTTSGDFDRLVTQYGQLSPPNSPSQSAAGSSSYPSCPTANDTFVASSTLPGTPDLSACECLENSLSCQFVPTFNYTNVVGSLIGTACGLLGQAGANCNDIAGNGSTGVYGRVSGCDPTVKLSYVMSLFYELNNRNPQACDFSGNATVNPLASKSTSAADLAATSCVASPSATFTPTDIAAAATGSNASPASSSSSSSSGSKNNGSVSLVGDKNAIFGVGVMAIVGLLSAVWTLV